MVIERLVNHKARSYLRNKIVYSKLDYPRKHRHDGDESSRPDRLKRNKSIDFAALTGRRADPVKYVEATKSANRRDCRLKRRRVLSEGKEPFQPNQTQDKSQAGIESEDV